MSALENRRWFITAQYNPLLALGSDLLAYWDASRSNTVTQIGGAVSAFQDLKAGITVSQGTGSLRPIYSTRSFNGSPAITFDGSDDTLTKSGASLPIGSDPCEIWALVDQAALSSDGTSRRIFAYGGANSVARYMVHVGSSGANNLSVACGNGSTTIFTTNLTGFLGRSVARAIFSGTAITAELNGISTAPAAVVPATGSGTTNMGSSSGGATGYFQGGVAAILVTKLLNTAKANDLRAYLMKRRTA